MLYQELYRRVELEQLFPDSKTFADAEPREPPARILAEYRAAPPRTRADLATFVAARFRIPSVAPPVTPKAELKPATATSASVEGHIASLWPHLTRAPEAPGPWSSALPLAHKFVVPGGRFREIYYWDSYFTMLGLIRDGRRDTAAAMTDDFADLIGAYGHVPNGSRSYYLSRSQPPVFYLMVAAVSDDPDAGWARRLPALKREYAWWMQGARGLRPGQASGHVVALPDGSILNRYWDFRAAPRDESVPRGRPARRRRGPPCARALSRRPRRRRERLGLQLALVRRRALDAHHRDHLAGPCGSEQPDVRPRAGHRARVRTRGRLRPARRSFRRARRGGGRR